MKFKNKTGVYHIIFIFIVFLLSCEEETITTRHFPRISIDGSVSQSEGGISFKAEIVSEGNSDIINKGFVWSTSEKPTLKHFASRVYLGVEDDFTTLAQCDLIAGNSYSVRAFIQNNEYVTYSKPIRFQSEYTSPAPVIHDFTPKEAKWGEIIKIEGNYFSFSSDSISVSFGNVIANIDSCNDKEILVKVPTEVNSNTVNISVEIYDKLVTAQNNFSYIYPEFTDFFPKSASIIDTITITGNNFHLNPEHYEITIGMLNPRVLNVTETEIKFIVPYKLNAPVATIKISTMGILHVFSNKFRLIQ